MGTATGPGGTIGAIALAIPERPPPDLFGEKNGDGQFINSSPGEQLQTAPISRPDQAAFTRDPTGQRPGEQSTPPKPLSRPVTAPPPAAVPTPPPSPAPAFRKPEKPAQKAPESPPTPKPAGPAVAAGATGSANAAE